MSRVYKLAAGLAVLLVLCLLVSPVFAAFVPRVSTEVDDTNGAYLLVNGRKAIHFTASNGKLSPKERADIASQRLSAFLQNGPISDYLSYEPSGKSVKIMVNDSLFLIVTAQEAKARGLTPDSLAQSWVRNLKTLLAIPPLKIEPVSLVIPLNETRSATVSSLIDEPFSIETSDQSILDVDSTSKPGSLVIKGKAVGTAQVTVKCGGCSVVLDAYVKKYAAYPGRVPAKTVITGMDPSREMITRAVEESAGRSVVVETGAQIDDIHVVAETPEVHIGRIAEIPARVSVSGEGYLPVRLDVPVSVENRVLPACQTSELMYSNDPERLSKYQTLYLGLMNSSRASTRLLYHHQNMMGKKIGFVVDVLNTSKTPVSLQVMEGISRPLVDTLAVGYGAGLAFLENYRNGNGRIFDLPPGSRRAIVSQSLPRAATASGLLELRVLSGEQILVRVVAKPEANRLAEDPIDREVTEGVTDLRRAELSEDVYPNPVETLDAEYTAGGAWTFLRLGKNALKHATRDRRLFGNYGVIYDINLKIDNPLPKAANVNICFEATAGPASGVFYVDGKLVRVRYLDSSGEIPIGKLIVPAGSSRLVKVRTMPLSGSSYPATITVRPNLSRSN